MQFSELGEILALAGLALGLLVVRAVGAAFEAALVAVGLPRAQELAEAPEAGRRARALEALLDDPEATAFTGRALVTFSTVYAAFVAGVLAAALVPAAPWLPRPGRGPPRGALS